MSYYELETQQGLLPVRLGRQPVKSDCPSTNLWDYVYAPRVRGGFGLVRFVCKETATEGGSVAITITVKGLRVRKGVDAHSPIDRSLLSEYHEMDNLSTPY